MDPGYFDYNATTPLHPKIADRMGLFLAEYGTGNPSSLHRHGRAARKVVEDARDKLGLYLGVDPAEIFFTSGGTESNNLIIQGLSPVDSPLYVSATEHPSILEPARRQWQNGRPGKILEVNQKGRVSQLDPVQGGLVSIQWVNNETGIVQDLPRLAEESHSKGAILHTDGAQGFFRIPKTISDLAVDAASITAHKSFGPPGVGALWIRKGCLIDPVLLGGPQEKKVRPGTENLHAIYGMGLLADLADTDPLWNFDTLNENRQSLISGLEGTSGFHIVEQESQDWPGCINIGFNDIHAETLLVRLDMIGVSASSGSACSSGARELSHVLQAMQIDHPTIRGSIRISIGPDDTPQQLSELANQIATIITELRNC